MTDPTPTEHVHRWQFDGDDPYVVCTDDDCREMRDALTDRVITRSQLAEDNQNEPQPGRVATNPPPADGGQGDTAETPPTTLTEPIDWRPFCGNTSCACMEPNVSGPCEEYVGPELPRGNPRCHRCGWPEPRHANTTHQENPR